MISSVLIVMTATLLATTVTAKTIPIQPANGSCIVIPSTCQQDFMQQSLAATNAYRAKHHVQPLALDANLNALAIDYACKMASTFTFVENPNKGNLGENIHLTVKWIPLDISKNLCAGICLL